MSLATIVLAEITIVVFSHSQFMVVKCGGGDGTENRGKFTCDKKYNFSWLIHPDHAYGYTFW